MQLRSGAAPRPPAPPCAAQPVEPHARTQEHGRRNSVSFFAARALPYDMPPKAFPTPLVAYPQPHVARSPWLRPRSHHGTAPTPYPNPYPTPHDTTPHLFDPLLGAAPPLTCSTATISGKGGRAAGSSAQHRATSPARAGGQPGGSGGRWHCTPTTKMTCGTGVRGSAPKAEARGSNNVGVATDRDFRTGLLASRQGCGK